MSQAVLSSNSWDRNTRKPKVASPPNACDCAVHVYGPPGSCSLAPTRIYEPPQASFDDVRRMHATIGIDRGVLIQPTTYGTDHRVLLDALQRGKGQYLGIALVDDTVLDAELERLAQAGVRGARFNFLASLGLNWDRARFERTVARIAELGWITIVHGTADELIEREAMLRKVRTQVVIDHLVHWDLARGYAGQKTFDFIRDLLGQGNFWIKLSNGDRISLQGYPYDDTVELAQAFLAAAPDRAIWATDWPHILYRGEVPNDADLIELFFRFAPDADARQKILVDNPATLFGF